MMHRRKERVTDADVDPFGLPGCGPTPAEHRSFSAKVSRRTALSLVALGAVAITAMAGPLVPAAFAATYPSWEDVQDAKADQAAKAEQVRRIRGLIQDLTSEVGRTRALAERASEVFYTAQQEHFDAAYRADSLQTQADSQAADAVSAATKAGRLAAQMYRSGGSEASLDLLFAGSAAGADDLLSRLGTMDKLLERNQGVYADAVAARNTAQSLSNQAVVARNERDRLQQIAEAKMVESQKAADAAQAALDAQALHLGKLKAQLAALEDATAKTVADYRAGVEAARVAEQRRKAAERAEARRRAAAAAAGAGGGNGGSTTQSGWARPSSGPRTSGFGPRSSQCGNGYCSTSYHYGVDISAGCGAAVYAAASGTVVYAGYNGGYGNFIKIDHGGGVATGYSHIRNGGFYVRNGQRVKAGDLIASEGSTGNTFGCNLHFETYLNGSPVNPVQFMAARGVAV